MCAVSQVGSMAVTHESIAGRLNLARTTVTRILNNDPTYRASPQTRQKVLSLAQELGYDFSHLRRIHRRRTERRSAHLDAQLRIILEDGQAFDEGSCVVKNLSATGALLANVKLTKGVIPLSRFMVGLEVKSGALAGSPIMGEIARCSYGKGAEIGVFFARLSREALVRLMQAIEALSSVSPELARFELQDR